MYYDKIKRYRQEFSRRKEIKNSRREFFCEDCKGPISGERIRCVGIFERRFYVLDYHPSCSILS